MLVDLAQLRERVLELATAAGLDGGRASDFVAAVNEIAANVLEHGSRRGSINVWREPHLVTCDILDEGHGLTDPDIGREPAPPLSSRGHGMWITRQLSDQLEIHQIEAGSLVRLRFRV